ncbi:hypothetical protein J1N35_029305 [Gossypium stocksii]|uniref:UBN2 domain-containing protein n=1 Tax=Gossypium stocksii TaxID=47602 RepID=A0A9D3UXV2_9ROSI|nr:hypothetical protein J1N35_029305 [Gossypium stocksii]
MFALKTTVEEDVLEHIYDAKTLKEAWDTLAKLFSKKNDTKLQLLKISQETLTIQMGGISLKNKEKALYASKGKGNSSNMTMVDPRK